ncbi:MAG: amino acid ABC transporter substrate-binding protein [Desulfobacula sp.]|nr:amino acid ABC transporter substrate-binding protein [Desulfobacula sp.]
MRQAIKLILITIVFSVCVFPILFANDNVRLTSGEWEPFISEKLKHYGIFSHIATEAFNSVGVKVEYGFFPWKRSLVLVEQGKWDGSIGWAKSPEREDKCYFGKSLYEASYVFFHLKNTEFDWQNEDDLQGIKAGVTRGYVDEEWFKTMKKAGKKVIYEAVTTDLMNFKKLLAGRFQIFATQKDVGLACIQKNILPEEAKKITYHPKLIRTTPLYGLFSRKTEKGEKFMKLFNQGIINLKESGRYEQMWQDFREGRYQE